MNIFGIITIIILILFLIAVLVYIFRKKYITYQKKKQMEMESQKFIPPTYDYFIFQNQIPNSDFAGKYRYANL